VKVFALRRIHLSALALTAIGISLLLVLVVLVPQAFTFQNLAQVLRQMAVPAIIAFGVTFVVICGRLDLSVGSLLSATSIATVVVFNAQGAFAAVVAALSIGTAVGCINGVLIGYFKLNSLITTLAMLSIVQGAALIYTGGADIVVRDLTVETSFSVLGRGFVGGIPVPVLVAGTLALVCGFVLHATRFGRAVFAVGGNYTASLYSSINVKATILGAYMVSGLLAGIAGVIYAARVMTARHDSGYGLELLVLSAVILGGTSLLGGRGSIVRTGIGVLVIGFMQNILLLLGFPFFVQWIFTAIVLICAAWLSQSSQARVAYQ